MVGVHSVVIRREHPRCDPVPVRATVHHLARQEDQLTIRKVKGAGVRREATDGTPRPKAPLASVVESVFAVEVRVEEYERLERELALRDEDQTRPEAIRAALNRAQQNASAAHRLYIAAPVEYALFETECGRYLAPMWRA